MIQFREDGRGVIFAVRIVPRASRTEIAGEHEGAFRIRIAAPPVEGAANRELIRLLAKKFKFPQGSVEIITGTTSKNKVIRINGATLDQLTAIE